jgi:glutathione synthase/RimK-type ligase-like ATP-grasp enzyme
MKIAYVVSDHYDAMMANHVELVDELHVFQERFESLGAELTRTRWRDSAIDWTQFDAVVPKACWDYFEHPQQFFAWLDHLHDRQVCVINPLKLIRWNSDKVYLRDLRDAGIPVATFLYFPAGDRVDLAAALSSAGWGEFVIKPTVSGGAFRTCRADRPDAPEVIELAETILQQSGLLVQPFIPEIARDGEWSLVFFGGELSHAVVKKPRSGEFRCQPTYGATTVTAVPSPELVAQARAVMQAAPERPVYGRVDGFIRDGVLYVMELELIEPYLFLEHGGVDAAGRFCEALLAAISGTSPG